MKYLLALSITLCAFALIGCGNSGGPPLSPQESASFGGGKNSDARKAALARGMVATPPGQAAPPSGGK